MYKQQREKFHEYYYIMKWINDATLIKKQMTCYKSISIRKYLCTHAISVIGSGCFLMIVILGLGDTKSL